MHHLVELFTGTSIAHATYPIHSSAGGRLSGLVHSGEFRRCSRSSAEYRNAISGQRGRYQHLICDV